MTTQAQQQWKDGLFIPDDSLLDYDASLLTDQDMEDISDLLGVRFEGVQTKPYAGKHPSHRAYRF